LAAGQINVILFEMNSAIIVAAGKGTRMGAGVDKLFLQVAGQPVVAHTWQRFDEAKCIDEIILVVRGGLQKMFEEVAAKFRFQKPFRIVTGGAERQDSVWNGLEALSAAAEVVAIHDRQTRGRNRRGGRGAAGDGHHQGIRRWPVD
jgi:2-C-methyl-D-erythritol 4-phosphate cytidylyltransferase